MRTTNVINTFIASGLICCSNLGAAYEVSTHAGMTNSTYARSILSVSSTYDRLGLTSVSQRALGETYIDLADPNVINRRMGSQFEIAKLPFGLVLTPEENSVRAPGSCAVLSAKTIRRRQYHFSIPKLRGMIRMAISTAFAIISSTL